MIEIPKEIKVSAFARSIGMNESLLRKYTVGIVKPSKNQLRRIQSGINELAEKLKKVKIHYD